METANLVIGILIGLLIVVLYLYFSKRSELSSLKKDNLDKWYEKSKKKLSLLEEVRLSETFNNDVERVKAHTKNLRGEIWSAIEKFEIVSGTKVKNLSLEQWKDGADQDQTSLKIELENPYQ